MKKINNFKDVYKLLMVYFISIIGSALIEFLVIEYDDFPNSKYKYCLIGFTLLFLVLIKLFKIKFKSVLIFLGVIMFLLMFILLDLGYFTANTYETSLMFTISLIVTLPFQYLFLTLEGYRIIKTAYIIVPVYMIVLSFLCYIVLKFNKKTKI
ncbi:MAG: hypothetical protein MR510_03240 [Clostridium sp.]|nr:hypothetical protein [Clostridium sp.]